jgi:DNA-binding transcriptional LysR family regulator
VNRPVRGPELAELRAFCTAVDLGSLGRAARVLHVSQPALSKRLRVLETLAGTRLLERSPRGVSPTPAGTRLYVAARRVLADDEAVEALMGEVVADGMPARLAASPTMAEYVLPGLLVEFEERHERHLSVELTIVRSATVRELVREGRVDLGLAAKELSVQEEGSPIEVPVCDDEVVVAVPDGHPWAAKKEIDVTSLVSTPMIMRDPGADSRHTVDAVLRPLGLSLSPPLAEIGSTTAAKEAAVREAAPVLLSALAMRTVNEGLLARRVAGLRFRRRFVLLYATEEGLSPLARALAEHLRAGFKGGATETPTARDPKKTGRAPAKRKTASA